MKRIFLLAGFAVLLALTDLARAQNQVGDAVRQELEDRLRRVERDLESVKEANDALRKKLAALDAMVNEVGRATVERANSNNNLLKLAASKSEVEQLEKALKESERRRIEDQKKLTDMLERLQRELSSAPPPTGFAPSPTTSKKGREKSEPTAGKSAPLPPGVPDTGVYHAVEKNQTALEILKAYNDDQKAKGRPGKITLKQLEAANPGSDMNKLRAGQKIFIPIPEK
jgi:myosin heavy subunit